MTDHDPQTVDRVARAIRRELNGPSDVELPTALESFAVDRYRRVARAALNAMPQPVGYGIRVESAGTQWVDESLFTTEEAATAEAARPGYDPYDERTTTVVALVPVEDQ